MSYQDSDFWDDIKSITPEWPYSIVTLVITYIGLISLGSIVVADGFLVTIVGFSVAVVVFIV
jgi:hypothetical protein